MADEPGTKADATTRQMSDSQRHEISDTNTVISDDHPTDPFYGAQVGNYHVQAVLGEGGFGTVYRARDTKLGRDVAIKVLRSAFDRRHNELFEREARALAALSKHPHIVQIFEWGVHENQNYFVLEYVESNAKDLLKEHSGGLPVPLALRIVAEAAEAVAHAHAEHILHRDIKPQNILIEPKDLCAKVADFGLATIRHTEKEDYFQRH